MESELETVVEGKKTKLKGYDVILENTIMFPEGGGQVQNCYRYRNKFTLTIYHFSPATMDTLMTKECIMCLAKVIKQFIS